METKQLAAQLCQEDWQRIIQQRIGVDPWVTVYSRFRREDENGAFFCALIPTNAIGQVLSRTGWEYHIGNGRPGFSGTSGPTEEATYLRFGEGTGIEPFVHLRDFHGLKPNYIEICEEFRLYHNLYHDSQRNEYVKLNDAGEDEPAIRIETDQVSINLRSLKQFLAAKQMHLVIYFDLFRRSELSLEVLQLRDGSRNMRQENLTYDLILRDNERPPDKSGSFSRLIGKKVITAPPKDKSGIWPYEEKEEHAQFLIGIGSNGEEVCYTCDPEQLYSSDRPEAPDYLTPTFFRRTVLTKYYNNPAIYSVEDGYLRCGGLWGVDIDNNHPRYVVLWLGDLGKLPYSEQLHWKSHNVAPDGSISSVSLKRQIYAEFADPSSPDLVFKYRFETFREAWRSKFGWDLFLPLEIADEHYYATLRIPLTNDQKEFDEQVLALAKILVDSLNEKELANHAGSPKPEEKDIKGITKLERFLQDRDVRGSGTHIKFMRDLYELRSSGAGHRKGKNYAKIANVFVIPGKDFRTVFAEILERAQSLLFFLEETLLDAQPDTLG